MKIHIKYLLFILLIYLRESVYNLILEIPTLFRILLRKNTCLEEDGKQICRVKKHKYSINKNDNYISEVLKSGSYWEGWMHAYFKKYSNKEKKYAWI